ncbi:unnamed protein product [Diplocarpon coronariae]
MSIPELETVKAYLINNLSKGFIKASSAPYAALVLFIKKANSSLRFYINYYMLNNLTYKDRYPLPLIDETLLDIQQAFHRIRMDPKSKELTTFRTRYTPAELNYAVYDKEMLAIIRSFGHFRAELARAPHRIVVYTDHKALNFSSNTTLQLPTDPAPKTLSPTPSLYYKNCHTYRRSKHSYNNVLIIIDRFSKQAISIPCRKTTNSRQLAQLYIYYIYRYFSPPLTITSDQGPQFISSF